MTTLRYYVATTALLLFSVFVADLYATRTNKINILSLTSRVHPTAAQGLAKEISPISSASVTRIESAPVSVTDAPEINVAAVQPPVLDPQRPVVLRTGQDPAELKLQASQNEFAINISGMSIDLADIYYALVVEAEDFVPHSNSYFGFQYRELRRKLIAHGPDWYKDEGLHAEWAAYWEGINHARGRRKRIP